MTGGKFSNGAQTWAFSAAMAQDWSSKSNESLVEGSPEWEAREAEYIEREHQEMMASLTSGQDLLAANWPSLPQGPVDFFAGFGDAITFGGTKAIREYYRFNRSVNIGSGSYIGGQLTGIGVSTSIAGLGVISTLPRSTALSNVFVGGSVATTLANDSAGVAAINSSLTLGFFAVGQLSPVGRLTSAMYSPHVGYANWMLTEYWPE